MNKNSQGKFDKSLLDGDRRAAVADHEKARKATLAKTEKLKALRLAKEAEEKAAAALKPKKPRKSGKRKLPAFEPES